MGILSSSKWQQTFIIAQTEICFAFQTLFTIIENEESNCWIWEKQACVIVFLNCKMQ